MTQAAIRSDVHQALDVHLDPLAQIAFNLSLGLEHGANATQLILIQVVYARVDVNLRLIQDRGRTRSADAVDICQADLGALVRRKIDTSYTSHSLILVSAYVWDSCRSLSPHLCGE